MSRREAGAGARVHGGLHRAGLAAGLAVVVAVACGGRGAQRDGGRDACGREVVERAAGGAGARAERQRERGTGESRPPRLINRDHITRMLLTLYLPYRRGPLNVDAAVCAYVEENGIPSEVVLAKSAGGEMLDSIAVQVGWAMRFEPALLYGEPVGVWVRMPVVYRERPGRRP